MLFKSPTVTWLTGFDFELNHKLEQHVHAAQLVDFYLTGNTSSRPLLLIRPYRLRKSFPYPLIVSGFCDFGNKGEYMSIQSEDLSDHACVPRGLFSIMSLSSALKGASANLCTLPVELKSMIVDALYNIFHSNPRDPSDSPSGLISLWAANRAWHYIITPYLFRTMNFAERSNASITIFLRLSMAHKYGQYCQSLHLSLLTLDLSMNQRGANKSTTVFDLEWSKTVILDIEGEEPSYSIYPVAWQAERSTLLTMALAFMPNVTSLRLSFGRCAGFDHNNSDRCGCLAAYSNLVNSLPSYPLLTLHVDFCIGSEKFIGSDGIIAAFLESGRATIR